MTVEKANKSDHLADYLDLTFIIDSGGKLSARLYYWHDYCELGSKPTTNYIYQVNVR